MFDRKTTAALVWTWRTEPESEYYIIDMPCIYPEDWGYCRVCPGRPVFSVLHRGVWTVCTCVRERERMDSRQLLPSVSDSSMVRVEFKALLEHHRAEAEWGWVRQSESKWVRRASPWSGKGYWIITDGFRVTVWPQVWRILIIYLIVCMCWLINLREICRIN